MVADCSGRFAVNEAHRADMGGRKAKRMQRLERPERKSQRRKPHGQPARNAAASPHQDQRLGRHAPFNKRQAEEKPDLDGDAECPQYADHLWRDLLPAPDDGREAIVKAVRGSG
jgi:hypothetical protein